MAGDSDRREIGVPADTVFLEDAPCFSSNALLLCAYGNPTIFAHPVENGGSRKKTVPLRNAFDWLGSENTGSKTAHFIIRNCYRSGNCGLGEFIVNSGTHVSSFVCWFLSPAP